MEKKAEEEQDSTHDETKTEGKTFLSVTDRVFLFAVMIFFLGILFGVLYLVKMFIGINFFDDIHLGGFIIGL